MMPEQAVQQAFRRQTGDYPKPAAKSAWEDIRRREAQAEQRRAAVEKAKTEPQASAPAEKPLPEGLNQDETHIVTLVRDGVSTPEELIDRCGLPAPRVMSLVTMLEMDGILRREKGRLIPVSYTHLDVYKRQSFARIPRVSAATRYGRRRHGRSSWRCSSV